MTLLERSWASRKPLHWPCISLPVAEQLGLESIDVDPLHGSCRRQQLAIVVAIDLARAWLCEESGGPHIHLARPLTPPHFAIDPQWPSTLVVSGIECQLLAVSLEALSCLFTGVPDGILVCLLIELSTHIAISGQAPSKQRLACVLSRDELGEKLARREGALIVSEVLAIAVSQVAFVIGSHHICLDHFSLGLVLDEGFAPFAVTTCKREQVCEVVLDLHPLFHN